MAENESFDEDVESESGVTDNESDDSDTSSYTSDNSEDDEDDTPFESIISSAKKEVFSDPSNTEFRGDDQTKQMFITRKLRKAFREKYCEALLRMQELRKHSIHQAVMDTAKRLRRDEDMSHEESIEGAISKRKYLLNKLIPSDVEDENSETE